MKAGKRIGLVVAGLMPTYMAASAAPIIVTSAQINAYFGTAKLVTPGGTTLFAQNYLFLSNPISADLAAEITADPNANAFPIFQNNVTPGATFDSTLFVQEINNGNCVTPGPVCDPTHPLPILSAEPNLTTALHNLPLPSGDTLQVLIDTGEVFKGNLPDYVVSAFASDGTTVIQASINISLFEHDFTAIAAPASAAPEPSTWLLMAGGLGTALLHLKLRRNI